MMPAIPLHARVLWAVLKPSAAFTVVLPLAFGGWMYLVRSDPLQIEAVAGAALILQMFTVSTGYLDRLRRGYFDPILVAPSARLNVAWAHWVISVAPGLATWVAIAIVDAWLRPGRLPVALTPPALAAFFWVSAASWFLSLPTRRYAGGGLWLVVFMALGASQQLLTLRAVFRTAGDGWAAGARAALCAWVFPLLMLSEPPSIQTQIIVLAGACGVLIAGLVFVVRADAALQDSV